MRTLLTALLVCAVVSAPAGAQSQQETARRNQEQSMKLQAALADAQAKANRPNDSKLSCNAMQEEVVALMHDPTVTAVAVQNGAVAQQQLDEMEKQKGAAQARAATGIASGIFMGIASSFIPGLGMITGRSQGAAMQAQAAQMQAQTAANNEQMVVMADRMITILPQIMRANHLLELGQAKKCDWIPADAQGMPPATGGRGR
jgi:hypothetical protein